MSSFDAMLATLKAATGYKGGENNTSQQPTSNRKLDKRDRLRSNIHRMQQVASLKKVIQNSNSIKKGSISTNCHVHLAVCVLIVDDLPHEKIWKRWMASGNEPPPAANGKNEECEKEHDKKVPAKDESHGDVPNDNEQKIFSSAELFIHAKFPEKISSSWVRSKLLAKSFRPNWNDVRIVQAMLATATQALNSNQKTTHVLFCTESCIPITSLQGAAKAIVGDDLQLDYSFLSAFNGSSSRCTRFDERSCWSKLEGMIPREAIWKALPGWCVLSKPHIQAILDMPTQHLEHDNLWPLFTDVWAPEEVFFPTALSLLGYLPSDQIRPRSLMHSEWPKASDSNPVEYDGRFGNRLVSNLVEQGFLFMRKLRYPINVKTWEQIVLQEVQENSIAKRSREDEAQQGLYPSTTDYSNQRYKRGKPEHTYHGR